MLENRGAYDLGIRKVEMPELSWPDFQDLAAQQQVFSAHFVVRPDRRAIPQLTGRVVDSLVGFDRQLVVDDPQRLETLLADTLVARRRTLRILVLASAIVFMLTAFSISGALTEFVANKAKELALRTALGASWRDTAVLLAAYVARPCVAGLIVGAVGGWLLARTLSNELFGVAADDPVTMALTVQEVLGFLACTLCWASSGRTVRTSARMQSLGPSLASAGTLRPVLSLNAWLALGAG